MSVGTQHGYVLGMCMHNMLQITEELSNTSDDVILTNGITKVSIIYMILSLVSEYDFAISPLACVLTKKQVKVRLEVGRHKVYRLSTFLSQFFTYHFKIHYKCLGLRLHKPPWDQGGWAEWISALIAQNQH